MAERKQQDESTTDRLQAMAIFAGLAIDYAKALQGLHPTRRDIEKRISGLAVQTASGGMVLCGARCSYVAAVDSKLPNGIHYRTFPRVYDGLFR